MYCAICGKDNKDGARFCTSCGAPMTAGEGTAVQADAYPQENVYQQPPQAQYAQPADRGFSADLASAAGAMYDYCKVSLDPKLNKGGIIATAVITVLIALFFIMAGVYPIVFFVVLVGLVLCLVFWSSHKTNLDNSKRLINIMNHDSEDRVLGEFASAQPVANDQFRMSAHYIFIKKQAVIRIVNIAKITRVTESTNFIPTGVRLDAAIGDETGDTNLTVCRLHLGKSKNEANEIFNEIMMRQQYAIDEINNTQQYN